jgi:Transposase
VEHRPPGHGPLPAAPPRPARARVTELTTALRKCPISELARFGRTLHTWRDEPAAHFDHLAVSNGPTENLNLKIKDTKRIAPATATSTTTGCGCCSTTPASKKITHRRESEPALQVRCVEPVKCSPSCRVGEARRIPAASVTIEAPAR